MAGFALKDMGLISRSMVDVVVEPHRKCFIPSYDSLKEKLSAAGADIYVKAPLEILNIW